jgi:hypothetical protein
MLGLLQANVQELQYSLDMSIHSNLNVLDAYQIIREHLNGERDVMDCHEALTRAGLKEYAKL